MTEFHKNADREEKGAAHSLFGDAEVNLEKIPADGDRVGSLNRLAAVQNEEWPGHSPVAWRDVQV